MSGGAVLHAKHRVLKRLREEDFGLAKANSEKDQQHNLTGAGKMLGTPQYMAPEQIDDASTADIRADIYSLGCTLYCLLSGDAPFTGGSLYAILHAHRTLEAAPLTRVRPDVPDGLAAVVRKMMAKDPARRYQTPGEAAQELIPFIKTKATPVAPAQTQTARAASSNVWESRDEPTPTATTIDPARQRRWIIGIGVAAAFLFLLMGLWASGAFSVKVQTKDGVIVMDSLPADADVRVDGEKVTLKLAGDDKPIEIRVSPGKHELEIRMNGFKMLTKEVTLAAGERQPIGLRLEPAVADARPVPPPPADTKSPGIPPVSRDREANDLPPVSPRVREWPADALRRDRIPAEELAAASTDDVDQGPPELVAILGTSRLKHWSWFADTWRGASALAYSADGTTLATGSYDGTARLWDTRTGRLVHTYAGHDAPLWAMGLSPDCMTLATGYSDGTLVLWEARTGRMRMTLENQQGEIRCLAFTPDGKSLAGAVLEPTSQIRIWESTTGRLQRSIPAPSKTWCVAFSPDGTTVAGGGGRWWGPDKERSWVRVFDVQTGKERHVLLGHAEPVTSVCFSPDGKLLSSTSWDQTARLWDSSTGKQIRKLPRHGNRVLNASFSPDGKMLATCCDQFNARLWNVANGKQLALLDQQAQAVAFSPDGQGLALAASDRGVHFWDLATGLEKPVSRGLSRCVTHLSVTVDGRTLASGGCESPVRLWDLATGQLNRLLEGHTGNTLASAFSPDGRTLATGSEDRTIRLWDVAHGNQSRTISGIDSPVRGLTISSDGKILASGTDDGIVRVWGLATGEARLRLPGHTDLVRCVAISPDGKYLASGSQDKTVKLWDLTKGELQATLEGHGAPVRSLSFTPDGSTLISVSEDRTTRLWDLAKRQLRLTLEGGTEPIFSLALSPDGKTLATAGADGKVRLRDATNGKPLETIRVGPPHGEVNHVLFTPDGRHLVTGNGNGTIYVLRLRGP
jgi:WD40 repeat protein